MKWLKWMWLIALLGLAGTGIALLRLPETVPMHYDALGRIDRWGSRYENLLFPALMLVMAGGLSSVVRYLSRRAERTEDEKERASAFSNANVLGIVSTVTLFGFLVMQTVILCVACRDAADRAETAPADIMKIAGVMFGLVMLILGNFLPKTRRNSIVGVRISWSLYNDETWRRCNRFSGFALILAGLAMILLSIFVKNGMLFSMGCLALAVLATVVYARHVYVSEIRREDALRAGNREPSGKTAK